MSSVASSEILINDIIKVDINQYNILLRLKNFSKDNLIFNNNERLWYYKKYKTTELLIKILFPKEIFVAFKFINKNINDYRTENIKLITEDKYENKFNPPNGYDIIEEGTSILITEGKYANQYRNMYWKVKDKNEDHLYYYMIHIKNDIYTKVSLNDINKVLLFKNIRPIWYLQSNGYIATTIHHNKTQTFYYLHQVIMGVHDDDLTSFERTVDHINQDKLDNRNENLRLTNMSIQNSNRDKVTRRVDAIELPEGIKQEDLPKYIVYRKEILDKTTGKFREYFYISHHPTFTEYWSTSKSNNVSIKEKLKQAKLKMQEINGQISKFQYNKESGNNKQIDLPTYISLVIKKDKYNLNFDARLNNKRYTFRSVCKTTNIQDELNKFIPNVNKKYPELQINNYTIKNPITLDESMISL
jgi:hypothetical protein